MDAFFAELDKATARGTNTIPGAVVGAVDTSGKLVYSHATGYRSLAPDTPPLTMDSTFVLGSCTKLITAIAALQCVERGLITFDESVYGALPELEKMEVLTMNPPSEGSAAQQLTLAPAKVEITLRHLLAYTSGVSYDIMDPRLMNWRASRGESPQAMSGKLLESFSTPLVHEPGASWTYGAG